MFGGGHGFRRKADRDKVEAGAHHLQPNQEQIIYPQPGEVQRLYRFTLQGAMGTGAGATASATVQLVGGADFEAANSSWTAVVTDTTGIYGPLANATVGLCYFQGGIYQIIDAGCQESTAE